MNKTQKNLALIAFISIFATIYLTSSKATLDTIGASGLTNNLFSLENSNSAHENQKLAIKNSVDTNIESETKGAIIILGKSDDEGIFKRPNFMNNVYLFSKPHQDIEKNIQDDFAQITLKNVNKPMLMEFCPSGDKKFHRTYIYISPNDTVQFEVKDEKMIFTGKNADQNNLYAALEDSTPKYSKSPYVGDLFLYKKKIKSIYEAKKKFVSNYVSKYKLSSLFISALTKHLEFEYYNNLINPRYVKAKTLDIYFNKPDVLLNIVHQEAFKREIPFDMDDYLDHLTIEKFKDSEALHHSGFFKNSLNAVIRNHFETSNYTPYSKEKMMAEKAYIDKHLKGDVRDYAIGRMIRDYNDKGFAYNDENRAYILDLIDSYTETVADKKSYVAKMQDIKDDILSYDFELSEYALDVKMINHIGDTITLRDIFNRSNKRIKVVDFWASWCPPCVKQIQESKPFKDRLSVENNVEWIYLSIDSDREKWLKKGKQLDQFLNFRNSYLLLKGKKSLLAKELQVHQIPRYVLFDKHHKVLINNAPSPSNEEIFERIIDEAQSPTPIK